jgi:hypothetical protein
VLTELGSVTDAARHGQWQMLPGMQDVVSLRHWQLLTGCC